MAILRAAAVLLGTGILCTQQAQTPSLPDFEAVSIKPHGAAFEPPSLKVTPARVTGVNLALSQLILYAYGIQYFQLVKADWLDSVYFDVAAVATTPASRSTLLAMLQHVLSNRFKLVVHRETKEIPMYRLVVAKGGARVLPADQEEPISIRPARDGAMLFTGKTRMKDFAEMVGAQTDRAAVDTTGLEGLFDFKLTYTPERPGRELPSGAASIFDALERQLGLKLEPAKLPTEILIVDHAERAPVEN
jgi:uncharacterized protein (TIGR03435 family)